MVRLEVGTVSRAWLLTRSTVHPPCAGVSLTRNLHTPGLMNQAKALEVPLRNVLWAQANASSNGLRVSALVIKGSAAVLTHWDGSVTGDAAAAETWAAGLVDAAYGGTLSSSRAPGTAC